MSLPKVIDNFQASLVGNYSKTATTITLSKPIPEVTVGYLTIFDFEGNQLEKIKFTGVNGNDITGVLRGLDFNNYSETQIDGNKKDLKTGMTIKLTVSQNYLNPVIEFVNQYNGKWMGPAANYASLPPGQANGEVRVALDSLKLYAWSSSQQTWKSIEGVSVLPDQTGHAGKFLSTDGTDSSWEKISGDGQRVFSTGTSSTIDFTTDQYKFFDVIQHTSHSGNLKFLYPEVDEPGRTMKVRLDIRAKGNGNLTFDDGFVVTADIPTELRQGFSYEYIITQFGTGNDKFFQVSGEKMFPPFDVVHTLNLANSVDTFLVYLYRTIGSNMHKGGDFYYRSGNTNFEKSWTKVSIGSGQYQTIYPNDSGHSNFQIAHNWDKKGDHYMTPKFKGDSIVNISIDVKEKITGRVGHGFMAAYVDGNSMLETVEIIDTSGITSVGYSFFENFAKNTNVEKLSAPDMSSVVTKGQILFGYADGCSSLKEFTLPPLTSLRDWDSSDMKNMLRNCTSLEKLILPSPAVYSEREWNFNIPSNVEGTLKGYVINYNNLLNWQQLAVSGKTLYKNYITDDDDVVMLT